MVLFSLIVFACSLALGLHFSYRGLAKSAQGLVLAAACLIGVGTIASGETIIGAVLIGCGMIFVIGSVIRPAKIIDRKARPEYRFCPNCSSKLETRDFEGKPKLACPSCSFVYWNNPIVVGVALIPSEDGDSIVLTKRGLNPKKGFWCLPGGFGEPNEHPKETAARESEEEASLDIEIDRLLAVHAAPGANQVLIFYLAKPTAKIPVRGSDAEEARFFKLDALPEDGVLDASRRDQRVQEGLACAEVRVSTGTARRGQTWDAAQAPAARKTVNRQNGLVCGSSGSSHMPFGTMQVD